MTMVLPSLALIGAGSVLLGRLPADDGKFYRTIDRFQIIEERGLSPFRLPEGATGDQQLVLVQDSGIPAWREAVDLLEGTNELKLSEALAEKRRQFLEYARLRLESVELLEQVLSRSDGGPTDALDASFAKVDSVLNVLNGE